MPVWKNELGGGWRRALLWAVCLTVALAGLGRVGMAQAAMEYNLRVPLQDDFDGCAGERILISGVQHIVGRVTQDGQGRLHFGFTRNTQGAGTGQLSGERYLLTDAVAYSSFEVVPGQIKTFHQLYTARLTRLGESAPGDDSRVHFLTHLTYSVDGEITAWVEILQAECR